MKEMGGAARWLKNSFAEWFIGSWALILGWVIFLTIFFNFLLMDGTFSRGLGEGSGVNPDRFQQVGWMYRLFAAAFLVLATKLALSGLKAHANVVRSIGAIMTIIVVLHATGFGLKALEGKRGNATAIEQVAAVTTTANVDTLAQLKAQLAQIDADLKAAIEPINAEIINLDTDKLAANDKRSDGLRERRTRLEDAAFAEKQRLNTAITAQITTGSTQKVTDTKAVETSEKWAPLFVGLAQLFTWTQTPTDWAIYICAVLFIIFWVLVGDAIAIALPDALYRLHLADAKAPKVKLDADTFKSLREQAEELERRMANINAGTEKAVKTKGKKKKVAEAKKAIEDFRTELDRRNAERAAAEEADRKNVADAIAEMNAEIVDEPDEEEPEPEEEPELELTEPADESEPEPPPEPKPQLPAVIPPAERTETDAEDEDDSERGTEDEDEGGRRRFA
jgi:hypothetical protein